MRINRSGMVALLMVALTGSAAAAILTNSADYTWTGGGTAGQWDDPANWTGGTAGGFPGAADDNAGIPGDNVVDGSDGAIFPDAVGNVAITSGFTAYAGRFNRLVTGTGSLTLPDSWLPRRAGGGGGAIVRRDASAQIGSGGLTVLGGGAISGTTHAGTQGCLNPFSSAGDMVGSTIFFSGTPTQTAGSWDIGTISLSGSSAANIGAWSIVDGANTLINAGPNYEQNQTFVATPNISGGRPNWDFSLPSGDGGVNAVLKLQSFMLYGNILKLDTRRTTSDDWFRGQILTGNGGTVDVNRIELALNGTKGFARGAYLSLTNCTVYIRGSATAWNNASSNAPAFNITNATTVVFDPAAGSLSVDSGSKDRNSVARDPADWVSNFAFDKIRIGSGDTITLTGNANIEGGGTNALYATSMVGEGSDATVILNGHNIYLLKRSENIAFDFSGGGRVYELKAGTLILLR